MSSEASALPLRRFEFDADYRFEDFANFQRLYLDYDSGWPIPRTEIWRGDELLIRINSLGCKGDELAPGVPVVGFFGDSATFGMRADAWPFHVRLPGVQILNAAVEGHNLPRFIQRFAMLRDRVDFAAVVVYAGWHNLVYNERDRNFWRSHLRVFMGDHVTAFCTLGTCLTEECRTRSLAPHLEAGRVRLDQIGGKPSVRKTPSPRFTFWGDVEATPTKIAEVLDQIAAYNACVRELCTETGAVLIDLHALLRPESYDAIPHDFIDICHPLPHAYDRIGAYVADRLGAAVAARQVGPKRGTVRPGARQERKDAGRAADDDLENRIYPLW